MKKIIPLALGILLSTSAAAQTNKKYDCDAYEVRGYILQNTVNLSMPTSITKPKQFTEALIESRMQAAENGEGSGDEEECFNVWTGDIDLSKEWAKLLKKLKEIDFDFDFSIFDGFDINKVLSKIGEEFDKAMEKVMEELDKGMCERLGGLNLEDLGKAAGDYAIGKLGDKYRIDLTSDTWYNEAMKSTLNSEMEDLGTYVFDTDELKEDINSDTKRKIRKIEDDFWNDL